MKINHFILLLILFFVFVKVSAQTPTKMSFQAIFKNTENGLLQNTGISLQVGILQGSVSGNIIFSELHNDTTNYNGLITLEIGGGLNQIGSFSNIDWSKGPYYIKIEADLSGGSDFSLVSIQELLSVPYSEYSKVAGGVDFSISTIGDTLFIGKNKPIIIPGLSIANYKDTFSLPDTGYGTVINPITGRIWLDRNLGAQQVATWSGDTLAYGHWYQWGRYSDGHELRNSQTIDVYATTPIPNLGNVWDGKYILGGYTDWLVDKVDNLWQGAYGINNPCPEGFRIPTIIEWMDEKESGAANYSNLSESLLKLPNGGTRWGDGSPFNVGAYGIYASSTVSATNPYICVIPWFNIQTGARGLGMSVRCIKD